jgi:hypothetical protein
MKQHLLKYRPVRTHTTTPRFTQRQIATAIAALRLWQRTDRAATEPENDIATDGEAYPALTNAEIDHLCDLLK